MKLHKIDINCDVGEGLNNEAVLFSYISRCNIACGGHAGDLKSMRRIIRLAKKNTIKIGAHPSYPDKENFGRKVMDISKEALIESIVNQLTIFYKIANEENTVIDHIKPHGALYNEAAKNIEVADAVLSAIEIVAKDVKLMTPQKSVIGNLAISKGRVVIFEAFADRNYNSDLSLVARSNENAVISDPETIITHLIRMTQGNVRVISGSEIPIIATSFCVHSDTENAVSILKYLSEELPKRNFSVLK